MKNHLAYAISAALLAGCSAASQSGALPPASMLSPTANSTTFANVSVGKTTPSKLIALQAEGKLPAPMPATVMQWELKHRHGLSQPLVAPKKCVIAAWATTPYAGYLFGLDKTLTNACKYVSVAKLGASDPIGIKVDASRNVWVADEYSNSGTGGMVQQFGPKGSLQGSYAWEHCVNSYSSCYGYGYDVAENSKNVFAGVAYWHSSAGSTYDYGTGIEVFAMGHPSQNPTYVAVSDQQAGTYCAPVCNVEFLDVDNAGNVWFDYEGSGPGSCSGGGLGEIANPTTSPVVTIVFPPCTYGYSGGVYVSNHGKVLNVTDEDTRLTYQYHLPVTAGSTPFNTLGPTALNGEGLGAPISGGFNATDSEMLLADGYSWLDLGTVSTNKWTDVATLNCPAFLNYGCAGAAFTPSDK